MDEMKLDKRMKRYEQASKVFLTIRTPVVLRIDGKAFHSFTKKFNKPFDGILVETMQRTMEALCKDIEGCVFGYTQSDEITLILQDYRTFDTAAWFDYRLDKVCSVGASKATRYFNKFFMELVNEYNNYPNCTLVYKDNCTTMEVYLAKVLEAEFDCRAFNVPKEDVCNNVIWRQQDAEKNSVQMLAQQYYKQSELNGKTGNMLQTKMYEEKGINWNELPIPFKRGTACIRQEGKWLIDRDMPILTQEREYVESRIYFE